MLYFGICASVAIALRIKTKMADEVFRKLLHCILLGSLAVWVMVFSKWWSVALSAIIFAIVIYPLLYLAEKIKGYSQVMTERKQGELKSSLLLVFLMFAVVVAVCWGWMGDRLLVLASIYAWGFGDAAAALIGKRFGKHKINSKFIRGRKSLEGTLSMFVVSFVSVLIILIVRGGISWWGYILSAGVTAVVSAVVELYTPNGLDTITCPIAAMVVLLPLVCVLGGV